MFPSGHFPDAYFTKAYFPQDTQVAAEANLFPHGVFPESYYTDRYFPGIEPDDAGAKPLYFAHRFFALQHFPDAYFPGQSGAADVVPPVVSGGMGERPRVQPSVVRAWVRVNLPAFEMVLRGRAVPATVGGQVESVYRFDAQLQGSSTPAVMQARMESALPVFGVELEGTSTQPRRKRVSDDEELVEHYMAAVSAMRRDS